jgi:hypothetical protein
MTNDEENFLGINLVPAQLGKVEPGPCSVVVNLHRGNRICNTHYSIYFFEKKEN